MFLWDWKYEKEKERVARIILNPTKPSSNAFDSKNENPENGSKTMRIGVIRQWTAQNADAHIPIVSSLNLRDILITPYC